MKIRFVSTLAPTHKHDCDACTFHGAIKVNPKTFGGDNDLVDLYTCKGETIARYGNDADYFSYDADQLTVMTCKRSKIILAALNTKPEWNAALIKERLVASDKWVTRGVISIFEYQTAEEQNADITVEDNGVGFNGVDAELLSSFAKFAMKTGYLSKGQLKYARRKMLKYAGQLAKIANNKPTTQQKAA